VTARYDGAGGLVEAAAFTAEARASVVVADGKARVKRPDAEAQEFDAPKGVIVTSAPDWTDTFRLCRLADRAKSGPQEFPGLWIHPTQPAQRLTFTIERTGEAAIENLKLDRYAIRLRGNSAYVAWADAKGRMIKLVSKDGGTELYLEGFEAPAGSLKPE
jgi:hypothetical protein